MKLARLRTNAFERRWFMLSGSNPAIALFWMMVSIALYVATTSAKIAAMPQVSDKFGHCLGFAVLTALAIAAYPQALRLRIGERMALFGAVIELVQGQPFIGRSCDLYDWLADIAAVSVVLIVAAITLPPAKRVSGD
jgi:VanZ family protein